MLINGSLQRLREFCSYEYNAFGSFIFLHPVRLFLVMQILIFFIAGYPPPHYKWLKDGQPITDFSTDPFYKIISAKHEDEGSYRCIASNKIGSIVSEEIKIIVACKYKSLCISKVKYKSHGKTSGS